LIAEVVQLEPPRTVRRGALDLLEPGAVGEELYPVGLGILASERAVPEQVADRA